MRWLIDEMLPPATAAELDALGHDARSARDMDLIETADETIFDVAIIEFRVIVTENFSDFACLVEQRRAHELPCVPIVFVRKRDFPRRGALAVHLARHLHRWAQANPDPYPALHWPKRS